MNSEDLLEKFPKTFFTSFRKQLLLGMVPAQTVQAVLGPLLSNFFELMVELSPDIQSDIQNILTIYPDVAQQFGLRIKPPLADSLQKLSEYLLAETLEPEAPMDLAAEPQKKLPIARNVSFVEGQGFFTTDKGNCVFLEFSYTESDDCASFAYQPAGFGIDLYLCGKHALSLTPAEPIKKIPTGELAGIFRNCGREIAIEVREA